MTNRYTINVAYAKAGKDMCKFSYSASTLLGCIQYLAGWCSSMSRDPEFRLISVTHN